MEALMSEKWIHGLRPQLSIEELTPNDCEMVDGELRPKVVPPEWKDGIRLIINGGVDSLDSATVPIEWRFSEALLAERPQYIVICDHEMSLDELKEKEYCYGGRRHLVKVTEFVKYIQLFRAGHHHLVFMVFCGERDMALRCDRSFADDNQHLHDKAIHYTDLACGHSDDYRAPIYIASVEFEVPAGLLAERPKSGFSKWVWEWANRWYSRFPEDECAYRKRLIFAFTVQPLPFLIGRFLVGVVCTILSIGALILFPFFGWRPTQIVQNIKSGWLNPEGFNLTPKDSWGVWTYDDCHEPWVWPFWCMPWFITLVAGLPLFLYRLYARHPFEAKLATMILACFIVVCLIIQLYDQVSGRIRLKWSEACFVSMEDRLRKKELRRAEREEKEVQKYLSQLGTMSFAAVPIPKKVDVDSVIKKADTGIKLKLSFWAVKAKVCKPFER